MILDARGLSLPGRLAPTDIPFRSGELTCVIGPNGSGKTSLLHALANIGRPAGSVRLDGTEIGALPSSMRMKQLSFLPATRELPWPIPAEQVVALGLPDPGGVNHVQQCLHLLGIGELRRRRVDRLSTGERSRVLLARALVGDPCLLLLDEPTANLDPLWQIRLLDHLAWLARTSDRVVIVALHDLEHVGRYADRLLIMDGGRISADGPPDRLLASEEFSRIFGIERGPSGWRPVSPPVDPQSSR